MFPSNFWWDLREAHTLMVTMLELCVCVCKLFMAVFLQLSFLGLFVSKS